MATKLLMRTQQFLSAGVMGITPCAMAFSAMAQKRPESADPPDRSLFPRGQYQRGLAPDKRANGQKLGQPVVVDSKPGGNTIIGTDLLAKAPPDGYTIGLITDSLTINPMFFDKLPYESEKDFDGFPARIASGVKAITTN